MSATGPPSPASQPVYAQQTFEAANASSASIVKPVAPKNVMAEFAHLVKTGNRFEKGQAPDEAAAAKAAPPVPTTRPATAASARPPLPRQESGRSRPQAPAAKPTIDAESARLVSQIQDYLRREAAQGRAPTIGELSGVIREITGQSWGGYWEAKLGDLLNFVKSNPNVFAVVKNKYVVEKGNEDLAYRMLELESAPPPLAQPAPAYDAFAAPPSSSYAAASYYSDVHAPLAAHDNPFEPAAPPAEPAYSAYGASASSHLDYGAPSEYTSSSFLDGPSPFYEPNPEFQYTDPDPNYDPRASFRRADSNDWILPTDTSAASWGGNEHLDPYNAYGGGHHDAFAPFNEDPFFSPVNHGQGQAFFPPENTSTTISADDWWASQSANAMSAEEAAGAEKAARRAAKLERKRQEEADAELARELQEREYAARQQQQARDTSASPRRGVTLPNPDQDYNGEYIVLNSHEMRDLAEKELGRDNVRIIAGFTVRKYGREGRPHQRKMWITQSLTHLAWSSSLLEGSHRGIEIKHVTDVQVGVATSTILKSTSDRSKIKSLCLSLVTQSRTLDLQACSVIQRDALVAALKAVIAFNRKYCPQKVDRELTRVRLVGFAQSVKKVA